MVQRGPREINNGDRTDYSIETSVILNCFTGVQWEGAVGVNASFGLNSTLSPVRADLGVVRRELVETLLEVGTTKGKLKMEVVNFINLNAKYFGGARGGICAGAAASVNRARPGSGRRRSSPGTLRTCT